MANRTYFLASCILFLCGSAGSVSNDSDALMDRIDLYRDIGTQGRVGDYALTGWSNTITGNISASNTDLLMPEWVYWSAGVYLLLISGIGVLMNIIVVIIILNDPQVITNVSHKF